MEDKEFTVLLGGYKIAIEFFADYANRVWMRFNILLVIDAGLAGLFLNIWLSNQTSASQCIILLPILGMAMSLLLYAQSAQDKYLLRHHIKRVNKLRSMIEKKIDRKGLPLLFSPLDDTDLRKRAFIYEGITSWRSNFISITKIPVIVSLGAVLFWLVMMIIM